ncbi:MAG: hypothetical protein ACOYB8_11350, partial [Eubacteriaceae bacterium]
MISVQEKLNVYRQYLLRKLTQEHEQAVTDAKDKAAEQIHAADIKLAEDKKAIEDRNDRVEFRDGTKIVAEGKTHAKNAMLSLQREEEEVFSQDIVEQAQKLHGTPIYNQYLTNCLEDLGRSGIKKQELTVTILPDDIEAFKKDAQAALPGFTFVFEEPEGKFVGGFIARDKDGRVN